MQEIDIWRTANVLIKLHGDQAALFAAARADELFAANDFVGSAVFHRIVLAIMELERTKPREGEAMN